MVNRYGEGGRVVVGILCDHLLEIELFAEFSTHGHTDKTLGMARHEVYILCGGKLCSADQISLILTVGVIDNYNVFASTKSLASLFNGVKFEIFHILYSDISILVSV
jgi:hypothetical protein